MKRQTEKVSPQFLEPPTWHERRNRIARTAVLLVCIFLLSFSAALAISAYKAPRISDASLSEEGELRVTFTDGSEKVLGILGSGGRVLSSARALRSAVSVSAMFTVQGMYGPSYQTGSEGAGVIYRMSEDRQDAYVITNFHVVYHASSLTANRISDDILLYLYGAEYAEMGIPAEYIGGSAYYDIAVLRVRDSAALAASAAIPVSVSDSDALQVGDEVIAIGNPEGLGISATFGAVSIPSEYVSMSASDGSGAVSMRLIRVDAALNAGNSGGGLYSTQGELIGIVNAKYRETGVDGIGYAIPSSVARAVADNIIDHCADSECESVRRAILGITVTVADSRAEYDPISGELKVVEEIEVAEVVSGSLAEGIFFPGDRILSVTLGDETRAVTLRHHVIDLMLDAREGDSVTFLVEREGATVTLTLTVTAADLNDY